MIKIEPQSTLEKDTKVNVKLVISAKTPYTKDLIANISLVTNEKTPYEATLTNSSNGEYVTLNLKINTSQDITIAYDNTKLILDESQSLVSNLQSKSENSFTITKENLEEGNTYQINFIKIKSGVDITLGSDVIIK
jgi:sucrose-6-phosphate hydrolase SacC (GH32 family)